ncbi:MAG: methyl-accepting chemotaxis protein [Pseudomonadota bacterium]
MKISHLSISNQLTISVAVVLIVILSGLTAVAVQITYNSSVKVAKQDLTRQAELLDLNLELTYASLLEQNSSYSSTFEQLFVSGDFKIYDDELIDFNEQEIPTLVFEKEFAAFENVTFGSSGSSESESTTIANDFSFVDQFNEMTGGTATIFQRVGDDFLRVSTSLRKPDGERAYGTWLGKEHPAHARLLSGKAYTGKAKLFGRNYITTYSPFFDDVGEVIGILYTGFGYQGQIDILFEGLGTVTVGESGYIYIVDASNGKNHGDFVFHPELVGQSVHSLPDAEGNKIFGGLFEADKGILEYRWSHKSGQHFDKMVAFTKIDGWDWVLATGSNVDEFTQQATDLRNALIVAMILAATLICGFLLFVIRRQLKPLSEIGDVMDKLGQGNFGAASSLSKFEISGQSDNEISELARQSRKMSASLSNLVTDVDSSVNEVLSASDAVSKVAKETRDSVSTQLGDTDQVATAVDRLNASVQNVADSASAASEETQQADNQALQGKQVVTSVISSIDKLAGEVEQSAEVISNVRKESENIGSVIEVIQNIAEQTNLLALNAAIESARAGEQGRGFAVVADEVRNLAKRTQNSTTEINDMIEKLQRAAEDAVTTMEGSRSTAKVSVEQATEAGEHLSGIAQSASRINDVTTQIAKSSEEQMRVVSEVNSSVLSIRDMTKSTSQSAEQVDQATSKIQSIASRLKASADCFKL